jgi:hypothetical protein
MGGRGIPKYYEFIVILYHRTGILCKSLFKVFGNFPDAIRFFSVAALEKRKSRCGKRASTEFS